MLRRSALAFVSAITVMGSASAASAGWHQGYVVEYYALQSVWGVPEGADTVKDAQCPNGYNTPDWNKNFKTSWRSQEEVDQTINRPGGFSFGTPLGNRGPKPGLNVYRDPTMIADPGIAEVQTNIGIGFDLDRNPNTGLTSPDGKTKGLDNATYKTMGCLVEYRGPPHKPGAFKPEDASYYPNDEMRQGVFTVVMMLSGEGKDPRNDPNMKVGFYLAKEQLQKLANNEIAPDFSYRIDPDPRFVSVFEAKSVNGVVSPKAPLDVLTVRDAHTRPYFVPELILHKPQLEITMREDGMIWAQLGGYRNWKQLYWGWAAGGSTTETARNIDLVGLWYGLERNADGMPDAATGKNTAISASYQIYAYPAFLITPETNKEVTVAEVFPGTPREAGPDREKVPLANRIRTLGGNAEFYLDGGAAAWPNKPAPGTSQLDAPPAVNAGAAPRPVASAR